MKLFNWSEQWSEKLKQQPSYEDILNKIQKTERTYWIWFLISVFLQIFGIAILFIAPSGNLKAHSFGLFIALDGTIAVAVIKIWAHIWLASYRIIWDNKARIDAEIRKSQAQDL